MSLLDTFIPFNETIFLKSDSNIERELNSLKRLKESRVNNSELDKDIKLLEMGLNGEKQIEYELKNANLGLYVLHDITIEFEDLTAQIDYVVVTKAYTYLIECKNMIGNVKVDSSGQFTRENYLKNKKIKESIYSPYSQSYRHLDILKKRWISKSSKLNNILNANKFDTLWYKPLVVMCNNKGVLDIKYAPKDIKMHTIRVDNLVNYIKKDIANYNHDLYSNKKNMEIVANSFLNINVDKSMNINKKYINADNSLKKRLIEFRKSKSASRNIPAYYIFTNDELDELINKKPQNKDELSTILSDVKVKLHGDEILDIINKCSRISGE